MHKMMVSDLFERVLENYPVIDLRRLNGAKNSKDYYESIARDDILDSKASVCISTHIILRTCSQYANAVGVPTKFKVEDENQSSYIGVNSCVYVADDGGVAVVDKSPRVYETHYSNDKVQPLCNILLTVGAHETDFRADLFNV